MTKNTFKTALFLGLGALALSACTSTGAKPDLEIVPNTPAPRQAGDTYYRSGAAQLQNALQVRARKGRAKNVILMIGDGMGVSTVTAGRIFAGQAKGLDGESYVLEMEKLPHTAFSRTYAHNGQVSDSASTVTALVSGAKANLLTVGVGQGATQGDCAASKGHELTSLFELAENAGRATGVVSTARITHATPAGVYGHAANRGWEIDRALSAADQKAGCIDLARQLVEWPNGDGLEVALGGGRRNFLPTGVADPEYTERTGARADGRNLADEWAQKPGHEWIWNAAQFAATDFTSQTRVLGLFEPSHMQYEGDRAEDKAGEPSLAEMTHAAITRLSQDEDGYVLMIEGGRIDHASHSNNAARVLEDMVAFDEAVKMVRDMTDPADTLVIVTADHSHGLTINGYPGRNHPILGLVIDDKGTVMKGSDGKAYTTLMYATGPGSMFVPPSKAQAPLVTRPEPTEHEAMERDYQQQALLPMGYSMHTGEDVPVFAEGPSAWLVHGAIEEHTIFHIMAYAAGLAGYAPEK